MILLIGVLLRRNSLAALRTGYVRNAWMRFQLVLKPGRATICNCYNMIVNLFSTTIVHFRLRTVTVVANRGSKVNRQNSIVLPYLKYKTAANMLNSHKPQLFLSLFLQTWYVFVRSSEIEKRQKLIASSVHSARREGDVECKWCVKRKLFSFVELSQVHKYPRVAKLDFGKIWYKKTGHQKIWSP